MNNKIIRVIAGEGSIRAFFAYTTDLVNKARKLHNLNPVAGAALGRLLTCASMMGLMMKSEKDKLTLLVEGDGPMKGMCVTADSRGYVKGYVYNNDFQGYARVDGHLDVGGAIGYGSLTVIKDLGLSTPYNSSVPLVSGEIGDDLTYYYATSEQTTTSVGAGVLFDIETCDIIQAGGFIVQLLPNADEKYIDVLEKNLSNIKSITDILKNESIERLIEYIFYDIDYNITDTDFVDFECNCNKENFIQKLKTLPKNQLIELFEDTDTIDINCSMCSTDYKIHKNEIF